MLVGVSVATSALGALCNGIEYSCTRGKFAMSTGKTVPGIAAIGVGVSRVLPEIAVTRGRLGLKGDGRGLLARHELLHGTEPPPGQRNLAPR